MIFSDIHGLDEIKQRLIRSVQSGKVAHAQLFAGPGGAPNLQMVLAFATYLNCENRGDKDACGNCPSCSKNAKYIHPDLHFVFPVSGTKKVKVKDAISQRFLKEWREFLIENTDYTLEEWSRVYGGENKQVNISREESRQIIRNLSLKSFEGEYKIMLIWLPEYFHPAAANGILKVLEEPPEKTVFLLVSNDPERLLTTILSRTQMVRIRKFNETEIADILSQNTDADAARIRQVARMAEGSLSQAGKLLDKLEADQYEEFVQWMRKCYNTRDFTDLVLLADQFHSMAKIEQRAFLQYGITIMRESLLVYHAPELSRLAETEKPFVEKFGRLLSIDKIEKITSLFNDALYHLERNASPKMTFLDTSLQIMIILNAR